MIDQHSTANVPPASHRYIARALLFLIYGFWFLSLAIGTLAYAGEPITIKRHLLPLYQFDQLFRQTGSGLLFIAWSLRALIKKGLHALGHGKNENIWVPAGLYAVQAALRAVLYHLHRAGIIFSPDKWIKSIEYLHGHQPHIMSDHILLAATVIGGLACEVVVASLALTEISLQHNTHRGSNKTKNIKSSSSNNNNNNNNNSVPIVVLKVSIALSTILAFVVSAECFYTARYFHPPMEIVFAAGLGLAVFQAPLLMYIARVLQIHERRHHVADIMVEEKKKGL